MTPPNLLSLEDQKLLASEISRDYSRDLRTQEVIKLIPRINYSTDYISPFGTIFEGNPNKKYLQAKDKIQAYFKYGDSIIDDEEDDDQYGGIKRRTNKRRTNKRRTNKRKTNKRRTNKRKTNKRRTK